MTSNSYSVYFLQHNNVKQVLTKGKEILFYIPYYTFLRKISVTFTFTIKQYTHLISKNVLSRCIDQKLFCKITGNLSTFYQENKLYILMFS